MIFFILIIQMWQISFAANECQNVSFDHLNLQNTEAGFCVDCESNTSNFSQQKSLFPMIPTLNCFKSAIEQKMKSSHKSCSNGTPPLVSNKKQACATTDYVKTTARSFYDITSCLEIENPSYFFALINRESRFHITAQSQTGASCYGQLTEPAIKDVNSWLPIGVSDSESCNRLNNHWSVLSNKKTKATRCTAHSNPYSCLFYSGVYYQKALKQAEKLLDESDIIIVKRSDSKKNQVFRDSDAFDKKFSNNKEIIKNVKRVSLFSDKNLVAQTLAFSGYNGGPQSARNIFKDYVNSMKRTLWKDSPGKNLKKKQKNLRKSIFRKKSVGLSFGDFLNTYSKHLDKKYGQKKARNKEVSEYAMKVFEDYQRLAKKSNKNNSVSCELIPKSPDTLKKTTRVKYKDFL